MKRLANRQPQGLASEVNSLSEYQPIVRRGLRSLLRNWPLLAAVTAITALIGFLGGYARGQCVAVVELLINRHSADLTDGGRREVSATGISDSAVAQLLSSDALFLRIAGALGLAVGPEALSAATQVTVMPGGALVTVRLRGFDADSTVRLANAYGTEASAALREFMSDQAAGLEREARGKLDTVDRQLAGISREMLELQSGTLGLDFDTVTVPTVRLLIELDRTADGLQGQVAAHEVQIQSLRREIARLNPALAAARDALGQAQTRYTDAHPKVKELRAAVESIEAQCAEQAARGALEGFVLTGPEAVGLYTKVTELQSKKAALEQELNSVNQRREQTREQLKTMPENQAKYVRLKSQHEALREQRFALARRQQEAQLSLQGGADRVRFLEPVTSDSLRRSEKTRLGFFWGALAGSLGFLVAALLVGSSPWRNRRVRHGDELEEATALPLLGTLGDLDSMSSEERNQWAFRTFTMLRGRFTGSDREALICGFTSAGHGEGRSTWIQMLAEAATQLGYRVLSLSASDAHQTIQVDRQPGKSDPSATQHRLSAPPGDLSELPLAPRVSGTSPVSLGAWAWNFEHREQWRAALQQWKEIERLVVFVELPPASVSEAVLLAAGLPNLVWLCSKDMVHSSEIHRHLETLRHAQAHLVGCVLNRAATTAWSRCAACLGAAVGLGLGLLGNTGHAQDTNPAPGVAAPPAPLQVAAEGPPSIGAPERLADWQKRLTLGPGDVFDISLYEEPDSARSNLAVGPDGRINYLEARDVMATGLTVDELRTKLEEVLAKFRRAPRVIINPRGYLSKKYYMLGNVVQKGAFPLDRPVSILEAIARARGFPQASAGPASAPLREPLVYTDLQRSFLVRRGNDGQFHRVALDFEALFLRGDLSQNIALEPDDFLFFPPQELQEVYVLGAVRTRGPVPYSPELTAIGSIIVRGGFTERAWQHKVLVVRGSLNRPQTFMVNAADILTGKEPDFSLKNRDIVYVHEKPWAKAQEVLETAVIGFANSFISGATYQYVIPWMHNEPRP